MHKSSPKSASNAPSNNSLHRPKTTKSNPQYFSRRNRNWHKIWLTTSLLSTTPFSSINKIPILLIEDLVLLWSTQFRNGFEPSFIRVFVRGCSIQVITTLHLSLKTPSSRTSALKELTLNIERCLCWLRSFQDKAHKMLVSFRKPYIKKPQRCQAENYTLRISHW